MINAFVVAYEKSRKHVRIMNDKQTYENQDF